MKLSRTEKILIIIVVLVAIFIAIIVYIAKNGKDTTNNFIRQNTTANQNDITNSITNDNSIPEQYVEYIGDTWKELNKISQEEIKLEQDDSLYTYFLMKQCLEKYYNAENYNAVMELLDAEAKEKLNITYDTIADFYNNRVRANFCIDKIYKQRTNTEDSSQNLYVIYHRIGIENYKKDVVMFVKIEERNVSFSIYPYEYLEKYGYLSLLENDVVTVNNSEISQNDTNNYKSNSISLSNFSQTKEFYNRYKFDIQFDTNGLYNKLDENYRNARFSNYEEFMQYVNDTKQEAINQEPTKYLVTNNGENKEFIALCGDDNYFIFYGKNLMEYTVFLDMYTIPTLRYAENYTASLASVRVRYCIDRIIKAINDKNYEFIYQKLNPVQKRNYYSNYEDFKNFIINNTYDKNDYEVEEKNIMVSSNVYQYGVKITDKANEESKNYKRFVMTVTIEDNMDFTISITK